MYTEAHIKKLNVCQISLYLNKKPATQYIHKHIVYEEPK